MILGRRFLALLGGTTFDWEGLRIKLGDHWKQCSLGAKGGGVVARATALQLDSDTAAWSLSELNINPLLSAEQRSSIISVLERHEGVFARNPRRPQEIKSAEHTITSIDHRTIRQRPLRVSPSIEAEINRQIDEMLSNGIIRPSVSPWGSRVILVKKKDGSHRFAVDYLDLNEVSKKDAYPMPDMRDIFDRMRGSTIFTTLDGPMNEMDRELTAFVSCRGQFEFNRMPFGLCSSQATYQRAVDQALRGQTNVQAFVDDTCVHSSDFAAHLVHLDNTLRCFECAGIQLRTSKCKFGYQEVEFLGHVMTPEGRKPLPAVLRKISAFPRPSSRKEVRQFMGLVNWYREYLPGVANTAEPLHFLTRKGVSWCWTEECKSSYQSLKNQLSASTRILAFPDWSSPFIMETDASMQAVRAVLSQVDRNGKHHPVEFYSSGLSPAQGKYSAGVLEAWAIVAALREWRVYLQAAQKVIIITDHNPLAWLRRQSDPRHKYARWILEMESYNYEIKYRSGLENGAVDFLSRLAVELDVSVNDEEENFVRNVYILEAPQLARRSGKDKLRIESLRRQSTGNYARVHLNPRKACELVMKGCFTEKELSLFLVIYRAR